MQPNVTKILKNERKLNEHFRLDIFVFEIAVGADEEKVDGHMTDIRLSNAVRKFDDMN
jgi:hypothetical protein